MHVDRSASGKSVRIFVYNRDMQVSMCNHDHALWNVLHCTHWHLATKLSDSQLAHCKRNSDQLDYDMLLATCHVAWHDACIKSNRSNWAKYSCANE